MADILWIMLQGPEYVFYLACTSGDHNQAFALNSSLVSRANRPPSGCVRAIDYGGLCTIAEEEVILSFARDGRPVVVLSEQLEPCRQRNAPWPAFARAKMKESCSCQREEASSFFQLSHRMCSYAMAA